MNSALFDKLRGMSWWGAVVGVCASLLPLTGCDPCMNNPCDDGLACDGLELCAAAGNAVVCKNGTAIVCDRGTVCTEPDGACIDPCLDVDCDDDDPCTTDTCVAADDGTTSCTHENPGCDDGDACTENDACDPADGSCAGTAIACAEDETCADGVCVCAADSACDDGDLCTVDTCDPAAGCRYDPVDCDDGLFCNGVETCNPIDGLCTPALAGPCEDECIESVDQCLVIDPSCFSNADCDDGFSCSADSCDLGTGNCVYTLFDSACHDGLFCSGDWTCNPHDVDADANGCVRTGNPCVNPTPVCNEATDSCHACTTHTDCDDGLACNPTDGSCWAPDPPCSSAADCDDAVACTTDSCEIGIGLCVYTPVDAACHDGLFCSGTWTCDPADEDANADGCVNTGNPCVDPTPICNEATDSCTT